MQLREKLALLEDIFEMEEGSLNENMALSELECWDSMAAISLIVLMDEEFGKKLTGDQIKAFKTVQDILNFMD
jgi:acyl carrier protein